MLRLPVPLLVVEETLERESTDMIVRMEPVGDPERRVRVREEKDGVRDGVIEGARERVGVGGAWIASL